MTLRVLRGAVLAALAATVLAACGSSSSTTSSAPPASASRSSSASSSTTKSTSTTTTTKTTTTSAKTTSPMTTAGSGCTTAHLQLSFVTGQGAAGTAYSTYALTNVGSAPCTLYGYPGVSILDRAGNVVQHPAQRGNVQTPQPERLVRLANGQRAEFILTSSDVIPSLGCPHSYRGITLRVFPPNQRAALTLPSTGPFCNLRVGPVETPQAARQA